MYYTPPHFCAPASSAQAIYVVTVLGFDNLLPWTLKSATMPVLKPHISTPFHQVFETLIAVSSLIHGSVGDIYLYFIGSHMNCIIKASFLAVFSIHLGDFFGRGFFHFCKHADYFGFNRIVFACFRIGLNRTQMSIPRMFD